MYFVTIKSKRQVYVMTLLFGLGAVLFSNTLTYLFEVWFSPPFVIEDLIVATLASGTVAPLVSAYLFYQAWTIYELNVGLQEEIAARKAAERTIQGYAAELEARNTELDAFAHTVAHDLKTPITGLLGFSALLKQRGERMDASRIKETATQIHAAAERLNRIVTELLLLASVRRMDEVPCGPLDLAAIVAEVLARMESQCAEFAGEIEVAATWPPVVGYAPWVEEVLANYVSNALKYGGRPPHVIIGGETLAGGMTRLWVRDNGAGLSATEQQQLFSEFIRLAETRAQGHGLGLSIVQRIVERLGGEVGVDSQPGAGCTFWLTLPTHAINDGPRGSRIVGRIGNPTDGPRPRDGDSEPF